MLVLQTHAVFSTLGVGGVGGGQCTYLSGSILDYNFIILRRACAALSADWVKHTGRGMQHIANFVWCWEAVRWLSWRPEI